MKALRPADLPDLAGLLISEDTQSGPGALLLLDDAVVEPTAEWRLALRSLTPGGRVVVLLRLESQGMVARLLQFAILPLRMRRVLRTLRMAGLTSLQRFAVSPDVERPVVIHSLRSTAARYARANLFPAQRGIGAIPRRLLARWAGCDLSIGALLIVGTAP